MVLGFACSQTLTQWFRRLHVFADALDPNGIPRLNRYEKLKTLSVNMHVLWSKFPDNLHLAMDLVPHLPSSLTDIEISCMSPDHCNSALLASIAKACPPLRRLGFYSASSDCTACAEEITLPFPIPRHFPSAADLAVSPHPYRPLKYIYTVFQGLTCFFALRTQASPVACFANSSFSRGHIRYASRRGPSS